MSALNRIFGFTSSRSRKQQTRKRKRQQNISSSFGELESRDLLAGITLSAAGELFISGSAGNDVGQLTTVSSTTVRAEVTGAASQDFNVADISSVTFLGLAGNDQFTNSTSLDSRLIGNDGNDILIGGTGDDIINGGAGDDTLTGNAGADRLIGSGGADVIRGGDGEDLINAGDGANQLFGDAGNDLIFGGADIDQIFGGDGADVIVGFDGDDIIDVGNGGIVGTAGTDNADLALGLGGNDTITGGTGLNVLYGGDGEDILTGGNGDENRFHGQNDNDTITGNSADEFIASQNGDDTINGGGGNDFILPGQGDDTVDGGAGVDRIVLPSVSSSFDIFSEDSVVGVSGFGQGFDQLTATETLQFSDGSTLVAQSQATRTVTVRPIVVSNGSGSAQAEFFGNAEQQLEIQLRVDEIFAAAGIDIEWETARNFRNNAVNAGGTGSDPVSRLQSIIEAGDAANVGSSDPLVIDKYFVNQTPSGGSTSDLATDGFAFLGANGIGFHTGSTLVTTPDFRELVARVAAHEIAHNLGLAHVSSANNLLSPNISNANITSAQITALQGSQFALPTAAAVSSGEVLPLVNLTSSSNGDVQADSTSATGGCGGCGVCAACTGA